MFQSVYFKDVFYTPVLFILVHVHRSSLLVGCEKHKVEKKFSEILDFNKLELFLPHLMFTLSLPDPKQQREWKCELGAGVYRWKNVSINTKKPFIALINFP